jgi:aerobic carbon-monoxide dehydrogenase medium subunit
VKPPPFRYLRPETEEGVLAALAEHGDEAKALAGGQSLLPLMNFRLARPSVLIDLQLLGSLRGIERSEDDVVVGAMTRQADAERSAELTATCPVVGQALGWVGHLQIRNSGTVGGSIAHADPAGELPAVALALDAEMVVKSASRRRLIPAAEFFVGPFTTALEPDELLTHVRFPATPGARTVFLELARRSGDFALAGVCAVNRGTTENARVALAAIGVGGTPVRLTAAEAAVDGRALSDEAVREAGEAASAAVEPPSDFHADGAYRRELLGVLVRRALRQVA